MQRVKRRKIDNELGAGLTEYGLLVALIALVSVLALQELGNSAASKSCAAAVHMHSEGEFYLFLYGLTNPNSTISGAWNGAPDKRCCVMTIDGVLQSTCIDGIGGG